MRSSVLLVLCCLLVHFHVTEVEAQYLHPKVVEKKVTIRNAVILPAKVEVIKESAKGAEMMVAESAEISSSVTDAVGQALQGKKITVATNAFEASALDESRRYKLADIQSRYDALLPKLVKNSKDIKKARFTLGDESDAAKRGQECRRACVHPRTRANVHQGQDCLFDSQYFQFRLSVRPDYGGHCRCAYRRGACIHETDVG